MTRERIELVKHYLQTEMIGLKVAIEKVKAMNDAEVQAKREEIAEHTRH